MFIINSSSLASWLITFLGGHPGWRAKATSEVESLLESYSRSSMAPESLSSQLAAIPLDVWETKTPVLDAIIKETTRVAQPHTAMRRNLGPPLYIDNKIISTGDYVVYPFSDVHLDPELYPDPWTFNPGRVEPKNTAFGYVGWGGGISLLLYIYSPFLTFFLRQDPLSWYTTRQGGAQTHYGHVCPRFPA